MRWIGLDWRIGEIGIERSEISVPWAIRNTRCGAESKVGKPTRAACHVRVNDSAGDCEGCLNIPRFRLETLLVNHDY
ncbi:GM19223 [Drosophila sechellia]|uniref:GM19223 n=1 Tax=Drosophila sechellia TaxID=7238 RepID=B4I9U8_DROSE|nr:GM19223 [Drosophila sechellia]